jgi:hypothetical protein
MHLSDCFLQCSMCLWAQTRTYGKTVTGLAALSTQKLPG